MEVGMAPSSNLLREFFSFLSYNFRSAKLEVPVSGQAGKGGRRGYFYHFI